jgi:hypothetical protein
MTGTAHTWPASSRRAATTHRRHGRGLARKAGRLQVRDASGSGSSADAIACLDYVAALRDRGVNVVATNNSWGEGVYSRALQDAIDRQRSRGILFIAAAGNDTSTPLTNRSLDINNYLFEGGSMYPCAYALPNVVCVASSTHRTTSRCTRSTA